MKFEQVETRLISFFKDNNKKGGDFTPSYIFNHYHGSNIMFPHDA